MRGKRLLFVAVLSLAMLAASATAALAEGYNNPDGPGEYTRPTYNQGPHGGYTTTTNKCADCHSTHYAAGGYKLLRSSTREAACDFCHGGGGGSALNIMMDNDYRAVEATFGSAAYAAGAGGDQFAATAIPNTGKGTGHTLGYSGMAPADVEPAYSDPDGFACFDCHTPHGNSARVMPAFGSPSRAAGDGYITELYGVPFMFAQMYRLQEMLHIKFDSTMLFGMAPSGSGYVIPEDFTQVEMAGNPAFLKWYSATPTKIEDVINNKTIIAPQSGLPMGPLNMGDGVDTELDTTMQNFGAWMANPVQQPTQMDIMTWYATNMSAVATDTDGYKYVDAASMMALMSVFQPGGDTELTDLFNSWNVYWGEDVDGGNIDTAFLNMGDWQYQDDGSFTVTGSYAPDENPELEVWHKPLFPKGKFLLLKNPDKGDDYTYAEGGVNDMGMPSPDMKVVGAGVEANEANGKKVGIDWEWPLGPAASWGPFFYTDTNERFPLAFPWAPKGVAMENEFCTSCHDGAAGMSKQSAKVYNSTEATYTTAYSHDSNNRGCARAQYINTDDDANFGPHCANCHTGSSSCYTCHDDLGDNWLSFGKTVYAPAVDGEYVDPEDLLHETRSSYQAPAAVKTSAIAAINGQCIDGGFSYPHRTLGVNMLKDELWGVDFDGSPIAAGQTRSAQAAIETSFGATFLSGSFEATTSIAGQAAQNMDSVCIDCHGDATFYNGDNPDYYANFTSYNPLAAASQSWHVEGWELLLKGLP